MPLTLSAEFVAGSVTPNGNEFLTNQTSVGISGTTVAGAVVAINTDGDGLFDDGQVTAANGSFTLPNLPVAEGLNALVLRATDSFGQFRTLELDVSRDTAAPTATVDGPLASSATSPSIVLSFDETVRGSLLNPASYSIRRGGQSVGDPPIVVASVTQLDAFSYRLPLSAPVPEGATYDLVIGPPITDSAGNALASSNLSYNASPVFGSPRSRQTMAKRWSRPRAR